jgi:putative phosphoribosyl transferase
MFQDREDAGRRLALRLARYRAENPLVVAIPRGGVVVGYEIAHALEAPLHVIAVRKLGAPGNPEYGIGAIGPDGVGVLDRDAIASLQVSAAELEQIIAAQKTEMERRSQLFRGDKGLPDVQNRTVILVDDGLATGATAKAAIEALRRRHPKRIVLAVPVAGAKTAAAFRSEVDDLICLQTPDRLDAVGHWYQDFDQVSDQEALAWLEQAQAEKDALAAAS